ncbi:MAG TPA: hypothetical protein VIA62_16940 [Thermoanaerobaculia bacterium]|jgi:hypothetical protein|nr:hypothetical protein [Thermoanaerobaculia bacterium]
MKLDDCFRIINRHLRQAQDEVGRRKREGLQFRPWQHRIVELEAVRREIAALATPEERRTGTFPPPG